MISVSFLSLLRSVAVRRGLDYDAGQVSQAEAGAIAEALNECAGIAYDFYPWPQTSFRTTNADGGWTPWDVLTRAYTEEPVARRAAGRNPREAEILIGEDGAETLIVNKQVAPDGRTATGFTLYYLFQRPAPQFTATAYSSATAYETGDVAYHTNGHCYRATDSFTGTAPPATLDHWQVQALPDFLRQAVLAGVEKWFARIDGAPVTAEMLRAAMRDRLEDELRKVTYFNQQLSAGGPAHCTP